MILKALYIIKCHQQKLLCRKVKISNEKSLLYLLYGIIGEEIFGIKFT